jgi:hypothetical protein
LLASDTDLRVYEILIVVVGGVDAIDGTYFQAYPILYADAGLSNYVC